MAYSDKINHKQYKNLRIKLTLKKIFFFLTAVGVFCWALMYSKYCPDPLAIAFTVVFAAIMWIKLRMPEIFWPTWDGEVVKRTTKNGLLLRHVPKSGLVLAPGFTSTLHVKRNSNGRTYKFTYSQHAAKGIPACVECFTEGEKVRHHRWLPLVEKEFKDNDEKLICFGCMRYVDRQEERCWHCGTYVLTDVTEYKRVVHELER